MKLLVPDSCAELEPWIDVGVLGAFEVHAAEAIVRLGTPAGEPPPSSTVVLGAALALWAPLRGHACIDLADAPAIVAASAARPSDGEVDPDATAAPDVGALAWPEPARWLDALAASPLVRVVARPDPVPTPGPRPLVLHNSRLYTQRQWIDECTVAAALTARIEERTAARSVRHEHDDRQVEAVEAASGHALTVVVGGPGTGKTHTIARLLARALTDQPDARIGLAAPTGKAAARLSASVHEAAGSGTWSHDVAAALGGLEAVTLHRLLGWRPGSRTRFRHDAAHPLAVDVVVVDETSMVLAADHGPAARGDAGHGPLGAGRRPRPARERRGRRRARRHRAVDGDAACGRAPRAPVPHGGRVADRRVGRAGASGPRRRRARPAPRRRRRADLCRRRRRGGGRARDGARRPARGARDAATSGDASGALVHVGAQRVLCAHRRGPFGVAEWSRTVRGWVQGPLDRPAPGDVVLATRNDARTGTNNGDTGVLVDRDGALVAAFARGAAAIERAPAQIAGLEAAYAMTVHKSQGSEYDTVALIHPPESSPLVGRELLYTAVTRAARRLVIVADDAAVRRAVLTPARSRHRSRRRPRHRALRTADRWVPT